jgi:hypothetical protein
MEKLKINFSNIPSIIPFRLDSNLLRLKYDQDLVLIMSEPVTYEPLVRMSAGVSLLLNENLGIVPYFRKHHQSRSVIDDWIMNTDNMDEKFIKEDLEKLENFLLSCDNLVNSDIDRVSIRQALKLLIKERCLWQIEKDTEKLLQILSVF